LYLKNKDGHSYHFNSAQSSFEWIELSNGDARLDAVTYECDALPVEFVTFQAFAQSQHRVDLEVTASEDNNASFEVQRMRENESNLKPMVL